MTKVFVTGATGTLGSLVVSRLELVNVEVDKFAGDITIMENVREQLKIDYDIVLHLAAMVPVDEIDQRPLRAFDVNVLGTRNLVSGLIDVGLSPHFFYCSTSHVYAPQPGLISESAPVEPLNVYGRTKLMGECIVKDCYPFKHCIARVFSYYHSSQRLPFLYPSLMRRFESEDLTRPFLLNGAESLRDLSTAEYIADKIAALVSVRAEGVVNVGSGKPTSIKDFASRMAPTKLNIVCAGNSNSLVADISRLESLV